MFDYKTDTNNILLIMFVSVFIMLSPLLFILDLAIIQIYIAVFIAILGIFIPVLRKNILFNFRSLNALDKFLLIVITLSVILSTIFSKNYFYVLYFGYSYEAMGALYWFSIIFCALLFKNNFFLFIKNKIFAYLVLTSIAVSTLLMLFDGINTRNEGILLQATSMGMWALFSLVIFIYQYINSKDRYWLLFIFLSLINLIATQSRIAYITLFIFIIYAILKYVKISKTIKIFAILIMFFCIFILSSFSSRYNIGTVINHQFYRVDLMSYSINQSKSNFFGVGASSADLILNNVQNMPESLQKTHSEGYLFDSSHNLYIDFMIFFGPIAALAFAVLTIRSLFNAVKYKQSLLVILFAILLANSLFNVTNILLTTLLLFFIVSFLPVKKLNDN